MKNLIIGLIALNTIYFIWTLLFGNNNYTPPPKTDENIAPLVLLSLNNAKNQNTKLQHHCFTLGPFNALKTAQEISNLINNHGLATHIQQQQTMETLNFLVYLQAQNTRAEAEAIIKKLEENKVKEYTIIETGPYKNAIALGSFDNLNKANHHAEYIRYIGYDAKYTKQKTPQNTYWINYDEPQNSNVPVLLWVNKIDPQASVQKIPNACITKKKP